jgi:hypothetical protein
MRISISGRSSQAGNHVLPSVQKLSVLSGIVHELAARDGSGYHAAATEIAGDHANYSQADA